LTCSYSGLIKDYPAQSLTISKLTC